MEVCLGLSDEIMRGKTLFKEPANVVQVRRRA